MRRPGNWLLIGFWAYVALLAAGIFAIHPFRGGAASFTRTFPGHYEEFFDQVGFSRPENFSEGDSAATFTYREDGARTGFHRGSFLRLPLAPVWKSASINVGIHGASKSSPAVDGSGIYLGADTGWFYAFNHDGSERWRFFSRSLRGFHGTAVLDADHVIVGDYKGSLFQLRKADGAVSWIRQFHHAIGSSPMILGTDLLVSAETSWHLNGSLGRFRRRDGALLWRSEFIGEQVHSSPAVHEGLGLAYYGANNGRFAAIDLKDGKTRWLFEAGGAIKGTPAVHGNAVYFSTWGKEALALDAASGGVLWRTPLDGISQSSHTLIPELKRAVFSSHFPESVLYGLNLETGAIEWKRPLGKGTRAMGSGVAFRERPAGPPRLLHPCERKTLCVLDPKDGKLLQRLPLDGPLTGVPAIHGNAVYVALDEGGLVRFDGSGL